MPQTRKVSAFVILLREDTREMYMVVNTRKQYGAPGGRGERDKDASPLGLALREFREETGAELPHVVRVGDDAAGRPLYDVDRPEHFYDYVCYGNCYCDCYFFYKTVSADVAASLPTGVSPDPCGSEAFVTWAQPTRVWGGLRRHIRDGIKLIQARSRLWADLLTGRRAGALPRKGAPLRATKDAGLAPSRPALARRSVPPRVGLAPFCNKNAPPREAGALARCCARRPLDVCVSLRDFENMVRAAAANYLF